MSTLVASPATPALDHLCRSCSYSLRGNNSGQCPECGTPYDPADPRTYYDRSHVIRVREVGLSQKLLIWAVLASILGWVIPFAFLLAIPFQLYAVFRLARANGNGVPATVALMLLMFVPLVSLIVLLVINNSATNLLREAGIKVGLMGARASDLPPDVSRS